MAKRRSFVPESPNAASLEGRIAPSTFGAIGDWFSSEYKNVKQDLGITHKSSKTNAAAGIQDLWNSSSKPSKPAHAAKTAHPLVTSNDTVKLLN